MKKSPVSCANTIRRNVCQNRGSISSESILTKFLLGVKMNKETEQAFEAVKRAIKRNRFMVHEICAAYLGCDPDDVVLRCRKKNGGNYAKSERGAEAASRFDEKNG